MKVLLVGEASGVHANLKKGLLDYGCDVQHFIKYESQQGRSYDDSFSKAQSGLIGGVKRNVSPIIKSIMLDKFDVINMLNTITSVHGSYTKYYDIPILSKKADKLSYYAVGCDELGLIRKNEALSYSPCYACIKSKDTLSNDCQSHLLPRYDKSIQIAKKYFDVGACSMIEYSHVKKVFSNKPFSRIPLPIDVNNIEYKQVVPKKKLKIAHAPTRRGFKGTEVVLAAIEILNKIRNDFEFILVEGLSFPGYLEVMREVDVVIDQVYSQSPGMNALEMMAAGKVVLTGSTEQGKTYFDFMKHTPAINASPDPYELSGELNCLLDNRQRLQEISYLGRKYIEENHSTNKVASQFLDLWGN